MNSTFLAGCLWGLSTGLAAWLWYPSPLAPAGAVIGCASATLLAVSGSRRRLIVAAACWIALALLTLGLLLVPFPLISAEASVLTRATLCCALSAFAVVLACHRAGHAVLQIPECALYALPWIVSLWGHRQGNLDRPASLVENAWAVGLDPFRLFAALGVLLGALVILLLICRRCEIVRWRNLGSLVLVGALCILAMPVGKVARLSGEIAPSIDQSSSSVMPKEADSPVAVVVFHQDYDPESGLYHFTAAAPGDDTAPSEGRSTRYRVAEMTRQAEPLAMGWSPRITELGLPDGHTFTRIYDVESRLLASPLADLLAEGEAPPVPEATGSYRDLAREIVPLSERANPLRAALRIQLWMEQNRVQSVADGPNDSVDSCLRDRQPVGQQAYTLAALELMRGLGLNARLVQGYAARADQKGEGSFLLLTESNRRCWIALRLPGSGWTDIDLYPLDGPSDSDGPQRERLQRRLGELARTPGRETVTSLDAADSVRGTLGFLLFASIVISGGLLIKSYRALRVRWCSAADLPLWGYVAVLDRLAEVGDLRRAGETRHEFALRLKDRVPSLQALTQLHHRASLGRPDSATDNHGQARALTSAALGECASSFPRFRRWAGWLHPFAWTKVL